MENLNVMMGYIAVAIFALTVVGSLSVVALRALKLTKWGNQHREDIDGLEEALTHLMSVVEKRNSVDVKGDMKERMKQMSPKAKMAIDHVNQKTDPKKVSNGRKLSDVLDEYSHR